MRRHDNGCFVSVTVSRAEVEAFKRSWPCSTLPDRPVWAQFSRRNGDLVDLRPAIDGHDALALIEDAKTFAFATP
jgi:hypothetical protein